MIINKTIFKPLLGWMYISAIFASPQSYAQDPVSVRALAVHSADNIKYNYQVSNRTSTRSIITLNIGDRGEQAPDPAIIANMQPELSVFPVGSYWGPPTTTGDQRGTSLRLGGVFTSPPGWTASILGYEETTNFSVNWNDSAEFDQGILPGQTFNFSVTVPAANTQIIANYSTLGDLAYLKGHFTVEFDDNEEPRAYTGPIVPIDTTPPTLSVTLTPATLWPPNDKLVPVTATIVVQDDYDPEPEIKLESITASETLANGDIQDAQFFTDDRGFLLAAKRAGNNMGGRVYTVTYSATDASGNKTTASATVAVQHDQGR